MKTRIIGVVGAFDENGVYGIGLNLPWGSSDGRSLLKLDMGRFVEVTRRTAPEGKRNVLVIGRGTAEAMGMSPLPGRHMIVISNTLNEAEINKDRPKEKQLAVVKNTTEAIERALKYEDCGNIFFGGGYDVWLQALKSGVCTHAFTTIVMCDTAKMSSHQGAIRKAPEMSVHETFAGMFVESVDVSDMWGQQEVPLRFHNYHRR